MSKKRKSKEAKAANKPIHNLHPDAKTTKEYQDKLNNPETNTMSTATSHMNRSAMPSQGDLWGNPNGMNMGMNPDNAY